MVTDFIFDGQQLSDFGFMMVYDDPEEVVDVSTMQFDTIKAAQSDIVHRVSYSYENNYTSTLLIMKNPCQTNDDGFMTKDEISEMTRWLVRKQYKWFKYIDPDDDDEIWYKAQIQVKKEYVGANVIGLQLTINTNAPYGFTREFVHQFGANGYEHIIDARSDEEGYVYPSFVITARAANNVMIDITNLETNITRKTKINNCTVGEIITIYGDDIHQITSSRSNHNITNDFNYIFPRFENSYRATKYLVSVTTSGSARPYATMRFRGIRKVGLDG